MADTKKYLDLAGLRIYDAAIKDYIGDKIAAINGSIANIDTISNYATVSYNAWNKFLAGIDVANPLPTLKTIDENFTNINNTLAGLKDVYVAKDGYVAFTADHKTKLEGLAGINNVTAGDVLKFSDGTLSVDMKDYSTTGEVNTLITNAIVNKADKATTLAGYGIEDAYTRKDVDDKIDAINNAISGGTHFIGVLGSLEGKTLNSGDIFVASTDFGIFKKDLEYIYDGTNWYELGDSSANAAAISGLELNKANKSDVYTKGEIDGEVKTINDSIATKADTSALNNYVQKDGNKVLSDVNFSQDDKTKLYGLANITTVTAGDVLKFSDGILSVDMGNYSTTSDVEGLITNATANKADKATTLAGYGISDAYTKTVVDGLITNATNASGVKWSEVTAISENEITSLFVNPDNGTNPL